TGPAFGCVQAPYVTGWGDVNDDGRIDLEALDPSTPYDWYSNEIRQLPKVWFLNDGTSNPLAWQRASDLFALSETAEPGAILDLNQDGFPDQIYGTPAPAGSRGPYGLQAAS